MDEFSIFSRLILVGLFCVSMVAVFYWSAWKLFKRFFKSGSKRTPAPPVFTTEDFRMHQVMSDLKSNPKKMNQLTHKDLVVLMNTLGVRLRYRRNKV